MIERHQTWVAWAACTVGVVILAVGIVFAIRFGSVKSAQKKNLSYQTSVQVATSEVVRELSLSANGVLIYDATSHTVLYEQNADTVFPIASITKLGTAITALAEAPEHSLITLTSPVAAALDPAMVLPAKTYLLSDVVRFMIATSSNDAATALAEYTVRSVDSKTDKKNYFSVLVSQTLGSFGITPWYPGTPNGLDSAYEPTVYASAQSIAQATLHFIHTYPELAAQLNPSDVYEVIAQDGTRYSFDHTLAHDGGVPKEIVFAKTGYTDDASGSLVFVMDHPSSQHMIVVVLLNMPREARLPEATKLIRALGTVLL